MKLKFIKAEDLDRNAKATVHTSGKLGFSSDAMGLLGLDENKYIAFATNEEDVNDENLYAVVYGSTQEGAFKISKAGEYFYVNTKSMFEALGIDYKNVKIIYDIVKTQYEGDTIFKMLKREIKKKKKETPT
jgi:hypothetical protein